MRCDESFPGHYHNNDYTGEYNDIALAFDRTTGEDAYGLLERGARIIELTQGERAFDTWIRKPSVSELKYYYPSGITAADEQTMEYLKLASVGAMEQGLSFGYYKSGRFEKVGDLKSKGKLMKSGFVDDVRLEIATAKDSFGIEFQGWIQIRETAVYSFYT